MKREKRSKIIWIALAIVFLFFAGFFVWVIKLYQDYQNIPTEYLIGNRVSNVNTLREKGLPFSFLVIGDTEGTERAETLIKLASKEGTPSFMVILGDFVNHPDIWNHRFFLREMITGIKPSFPVFLVAGNHDIDFSSSKIKSRKRRVTTEIYESLYGPMNFDFIFNNCLFIICGIDLKNPSVSLNYLRYTLSKKGGNKKYIFVFIHYPPKGLVDYIKGSLPISNEEEFFSLLETYKVTTCFFGDYHGYWRGQRKGVNLIVSGGGGRLKRSQPEWGKFYHILRINVDENQISEEMIILRNENKFEVRIKKAVFTKFFPIIQDIKWILYVLVLIFLFCGIYCIIIFIGYFRRKS